MQTVRQIERFWAARQYDRLARELLLARAESCPRLLAELAQPAPAAALALIRLDELHQAHLPLAQKLIRAILGAQEADGGWHDPVATAVCLRALLLNRGSGTAVARAIEYLADLQKTDGSWPSEPIRRLAGDPFTTAFILFQLADNPPFAQSIRLKDALDWLAQNEPKDGESRRIWQTATTRAQFAHYDTPKVN
jgi:hypothetical protein